MRVLETQTVACPFSAVIEFAAQHVREAAAVTGTSAGAALDLVRFTCEVVPDATDATRYHDALRLGCRQASGTLPQMFEGLLTVRPDGTRAKLSLDVEVDAPAPADAARATVQALLSEIVVGVERQWRQFIDASPTPAICNTRSAMRVEVVPLSLA